MSTVSCQQSIIQTHSYVFYSLLALVHRFSLIPGIADFAKESNAKGLGPPKVHLSFSLDGSGVVFLSKAEATYELPSGNKPNFTRSLY